MKYSSCAILVCIVTLLGGCGASRSASYPNLSSYKLKMTSGTLLADCVIIDEMIGDTNKIDVVVNRGFGGLILTYFTDRMLEKGYHIDNNVLTSVGLAMDPHHVYKVVQSNRSKDADLEDLPTGVPPFYLNEVFSSDSAARNLWSTYDALVHTPKPEEGSTAYVPSATAVGTQTGSETLLIILLGGYSAAPGKQFNGETSAEAGTIGRVSAQRITQLTVAFYILDSRSGELLWADQRNAVGGTVYKDKILRLADQILDDLP